MHNFRKLNIWENGMQLVEEVYKVTVQFPDSERFGLTAQVRRAVISIPSNIAEGAKRNSDKEFHHFLGVAKGSAAEVETQLELASRLKYLSIEESALLQDQLEALQRKITNFQSRLKLN
ncbi:MAG: four helix bundle protein [Bacteroidota bacterium]